MVDTHCHLTFPQYDADREQILRRAADVGVRTIINPGTDLVQSRAASALASAARTEAPTILAAVGVHPQDVGEVTEESFQEITRLAQDPHVVAIGEVGLERSARSPSLDAQTPWLTRFLQLANDVQKPVLFHVRDAHTELRSLLEKSAVSVRGVVHCFSGSMDDARWYTERGLSLGITGIV
ncbi:MAG: TatD DNase family protein, partial [Parcubacteria group bacterium Gr01-1014_106]